MKAKKLLFNQLVLQYYKCIGKLKRLSLRGLNYRKQAILSKRIEKIKQQLLSIKHILKKVSAVASILSGAAVLQPNEANAQNFQPAVINPFSIDDINFGGNTINSADYADIDADGDIDIIAHISSLDKLALIRNIGIPGIPQFEEPELIPVSLDGIEFLNNVCFGDLDFDGDFDLMAGGNNGNFIYFENTGTDSLMELSEALINPFNLTNTYNYDTDYSYYISFTGKNILEYVDIDEDGDLDIYTISEFYDSETYGGWGDYDGPFGVFGAFNRYFYFQNIGSPDLPMFDSRLSVNQGFSGLGDFADLDNDGDFDYMSQLVPFYSFDCYGYQDDLIGSGVYYKENIGSDTLPQFSSVLNPFGLGSVIDNWLYSTAIIDIDSDNDKDLMFLKSPNDFYFYENKICDSILTSISNIEGTLMADQNAEQYQWYYHSSSLDSPIEGATNQNFIPTISGDYFVQVNSNGCYFNSQIMHFYTCQELLLNNFIYALSDTGVRASINTAGTQYQWLDCNNGFAPIDGATNQYYFPNDDQNLAVKLDIEYCSDTTDCYNFIYNLCDSVYYNLSVVENGIIFNTNNSYFSLNEVYYSWKSCNSSNTTWSNNQDFHPYFSGSFYLIASFGFCSIVTECIEYTNCSTISDDLIASGNMLTVEEDDCYYQWVKCDSINTPIEGETSQTFIPTTSGSYAAEITLNNCFVTSECIDLIVSGVNDFILPNQFSLVPNPTEGKLNVSANKPIQNASVKIKSVTGQIIFEEKNISGSNLIFDISSNAKGVYFLEITENGITSRLKLVKE